jgi:hypothetical protein
MAFDGGSASSIWKHLDSKVKKLAVYEAPYNSDPDDKPIWHDYYTKLHELVAANKRGDAVVHFMKFVGVPANVRGYAYAADVGGA